MLRNGHQMPLADLTLQSVQLSHEGEYMCRVSIQGASFEKPIQLNVLGKLFILSILTQSLSSNNDKTLVVTN